MSGGRRGRPALPPGEAKGSVFTLRLSVEERAELDEIAERLGEPVSQWARDVLLAAARRETKGTGSPVR